MVARGRKSLVILLAAALLVASCGTASAVRDSLVGDQTTAQDSSASPLGASDDADTSGETGSAADSGTMTADPSSDGVFRLIASESQARFIVDEVLLGREKTVIGITNDLAGTINPDFEDPANTSVGPITIDLSTLQTDDDNRTRQVRDTILETDVEDYRYAVFEADSLSGLPDSIIIGMPFQFQIDGLVTIHGVTLEKTFDVQAVAASESRLEGTASLEILYSEFGVSILRLPRQVASVSEEVILELEFVAEPA